MERERVHRCVLVVSAFAANLTGRASKIESGNAGQAPRAFASKAVASAAMTAYGTFRIFRDVRLESAMRNRADIVDAMDLWVHALIADFISEAIGS
jgi:hypothetical protein